jgi:hypothetical protein
MLLTCINDSMRKLVSLLLVLHDREMLRRLGSELADAELIYFQSFSESTK